MHVGGSNPRKGGREASTHLLVSVQQKKVVGQSVNGGLSGVVWSHVTSRVHQPSILLTLTGPNLERESL